MASSEKREAKITHNPEFDSREMLPNY